MFLTPEQLKDLTGYKTKARQISALRSMGINFRVRPDGRPVVHESEFVVKDRTEEIGPDLSWMRKPKEDGETQTIQ